MKFKVSASLDEAAAGPGPARIDAGALDVGDLGTGHDGSITLERTMIVNRDDVDWDSR